MIPSVAHGTVSSAPFQNVWPFGGPTRRRQTGGPVAHSREAPQTPMPSEADSYAPPSRVAALPATH